MTARLRRGSFARLSGFSTRRAQDVVVVGARSLSASLGWLSDAPGSRLLA